MLTTMWTPIVYNHVFIIFENSSKIFKHWIESHLVEITNHFWARSHLELFEKIFQLRINCVRSDAVLRKFTLLPMPHFNAILNQTPWRIPLLEWIQPATSFLDFRFSTHIWLILRIGHWDTDRLYCFTLTIERPTRASGGHPIQHEGLTHGLDCTACYSPFKEATISSPI